MSTKLDKAQVKYDSLIHDRDEINLELKQAKRELDRLIEAERSGIDTDKLSDDEIDTLQSLLAKSKPSGSVDAEVNLITQDTEGGK